MKHSYYNYVYNTPASSPEDRSSIQGDVGSDCTVDYSVEPLYMGAEASTSLHQSSTNKRQKIQEGGQHQNMPCKRGKGSGEQRGHDAMASAQPPTLNSGTKDDDESEIIYKVSISTKQDRLKYVVAKTFRNKTYIDIRAYIVRNQEEIPTRKGITLSAEEFTALSLASKHINEAIQGHRMRG